MSSVVLIAGSQLYFSEIIGTSVFLHYGCQLSVKISCLLDCQQNKKQTNKKQNKPTKKILSSIGDRDAISLIVYALEETVLIK